MLPVMREGHWLHELFLLGPSSPFLENMGCPCEGVHYRALFHSLLMLCSFRDQRGRLTRSFTAVLDKGRGLAVPAKVWALYPTSRVMPGPTLTTGTQGWMQKGCTGVSSLGLLSEV